MALKPAGLLQPLPIPEITMDFITGLPTANNKSVIVVVVHRLSKYCHLGALTANYTPVTVAEFFIEAVVKLHGIPKTVTSDRDRVFQSRFWKEIWTKSGTTLQMSTMYHPQYLRGMVHNRPKK